MTSTVTNNQLSTIYQLLGSTNTQYRVFEMGRRVDKMSRQTFRDFEDGLIPYPYPLQQKAWFAVLFWDKQRSSEHFIWFLNFQLDEQGKLIQATRNHFLAMVIEVLGTQLTAAGPKQQQLDNNPYTFKPDQNKLALLNAKIKCQMNQHASVYYEHSQNYLRGLIGWTKWQSVGIQGIADFVTRLDSDDNLATLLKALPQIPPEVRGPLLCLLEHIAIPTSLAETLCRQATTALNQQDKAELINCLRAVSHAQAAGSREQLLNAVLASPLATDAEVLLVITGRYWQDLTNESLRNTFLERLAEASPDHQLFLGLVSDLVAIPSIRQQMLQSFRRPERSAKLAAAIGQLFAIAK